MYAKALLVCLFAVALAQEEYPPQPYAFNFDSTDEFGTRQFHSESSDEGNRKTGSYGYLDANGVQRTVNYVADENGFRASVDTNEPGTKAESPADVELNANPLPNPVPVAKAVVAKPVAVAARPVHPVAHVVAAQPLVHTTHVVAARPVVHAAHVVAAHPAVQAVHAPVALHSGLPVSVAHVASPTVAFQHAPVAYSLSRVSRRFASPAERTIKRRQTNLSHSRSLEGLVQVEVASFILGVIMFSKVLLVCLFAVAAAQVEGPPQPYAFNYDSTDEFGTRLFHSESGDEGNRKTGSYGYLDANGVQRTVNYVADENGFRATVDTNEPGTKAENPADVQFNANPLPNPEPAKAVAAVARPVAHVVAAQPVVHAAHVVAAQPVVHAVHAVHAPVAVHGAVPVSLGHVAAPTYAFHHAPLTYTFGRASSR
ncbi:uncharacterized protein LOC135366327 [Ornithodoros turicata]|uniref:uncharacterized protein LOC135366327 n=1 Tax=Ornithodoros turicata TaxID=34597 RepID=UPI003139B000